MLCTRIRKMRWSGSHASSKIPIEHTSMREETSTFSKMLRDRWIELDLTRLWTYHRDCSFSGAAMDSGTNAIMSELKNMQDTDYHEKKKNNKNNAEEQEEEEENNLSNVPLEYIELKNENSAFELFTEYVMEAECTNMYGTSEHLRHLEEDDARTMSIRRRNEMKEDNEHKSNERQKKKHKLQGDRKLEERIEEAAAEATDNTRRPVMLMGVPGSGTSSFLAQWWNKYVSVKTNARTMVVVAHIGELATVLDSTPALFRYLAWEICIQSGTIEKCKSFFDQSDERVIRTFGYTFLNDALPEENYDRIVICLDGVARLRDTKRFPPSEWLLTLLRPRISLVLTGSAVTLDKTTNRETVGLMENDCSFIQLCVARKWFKPRRILFVKNLDNNDRKHIVSEFVKSFEDCNVPDSSKYGAGAVAFSKVNGDDKGNALLDQGKMKLLSSPLTRSLRIVGGLLESIASYDTPLELKNNLYQSLDANNIVTFYINLLKKLFKRFPMAKIALQFLLLTTQGMTERELRLALKKEEDRVNWIEFCFSVEPVR